MKIKKRSGELQNLSLNKIVYRIRKACNDKKLGKLKFIDPDIIVQKVVNRLYDEISSSEIDELTSQITIAMTTENPEYGKVASRIIISNMHKKTGECFSEVVEMMYNNVDISGDKCPLVSDEFVEIVRKNKDELDFMIDYDKDFNYDYFGYKTLEKSYLSRIYDKNVVTIVERPQHLLMRVAICIHGDNLELVRESYELMSDGFFTHATPTLFNAGSTKPQCSSCFLLDGGQDSVEGIYKSITDCAKISKWAGGIGIHVHGIRSKGSKIRGTNGVSEGIVPMLKVFNSTARFINQAGRRNGSFAIYLEPWHSDIFDFLELKKNHGDEEQRARDLFYALWIPDLFMKRVEEDSDWYLMCPDECPGLHETYSEKFEELYNKYISENRYKKKVKARDLWQRIVVSQTETGTPYILYKDACNEKSNQKNLGTIKSSNLCVAPETLILTSEGYKKIYDIAGTNVDVWNGEEFSCVTPRKTGTNQNLITVHLKNGMSLDCTRYHKFFLSDGTVIQAEKLKENQSLLLGKLPVLDGLESYIGKKVPINARLSTKIIWLKKMFDKDLLDYDSKTGHIKFYSKNKEFLKEFQLLLTTLGCLSNIKNDHIDIDNYYSDALRQLGVHSCKNNLPYKKDIMLVDKVEDLGRVSDTYCFTESIRGMGVFNGILTGQCSEIIQYTSPNEISVCNLSSIALPEFVIIISKNKFEFDFDTLRKIVKVMVKNLNKIIDLNYYPVEEGKNSNIKHRPIGVGCQGLADTYMKMKIPFESEEARKLNKRIFEHIQYAALEASCDLAKEYGVYSSYEGSPISKGQFQHNLWNVDEKSLELDWESLRKKITEHGVRNSLLTALMPTASTAQILGNSECFEPYQSNIFMRRTLSGEFPIINKYLIDDLIGLKLWNNEIRDSMIRNNGSIQNIDDIPENIKEIYKTVWEISQKAIIDQSADRAIFIDQSQSLNLFLAEPSYSKITSMQFYAWKKGLKTGQYYLRTKAAREAIQITIPSENKQEEELVCNMEEGCLMCSG